MMSEVNEITETKTAVDITAVEFPKHIDIDLSNKCNLRCRFCHLSFLEPEKWQQLSYDQFLEIAPVLEKVESISLFSKYEPLTCRDFIPIFDKVCEYDVETYFSTNGILLNDDIINALVGRLTYLTVSVTGFTRESYAKNMSQDRLETVRENLTKLNTAKKAANTIYPKLRITFVGMLDTLDELCRSLDFAAEFEASEGVRMTYFRSYGEGMGEYMPLNEPETVAAAIDEATAYAKRLGVSFESLGVNSSFWQFSAGSRASARHGSYDEFLQSFRARYFCSRSGRNLCRKRQHDLRRLRGMPDVRPHGGSVLQQCAVTGAVQAVENERHPDFLPDHPDS